MKKKLPIIAVILIFAVGVGILSYPLVSSVVNNISARNGAESYSNQVESLDTSYVDEMFARAEEYNRSLTDNIILTDPFDEEAYEKIGANYASTLDVDGKGLIGYVDIPKINVYLPVYHGTAESTLSKGAGHLEQTSLPIGGASTHSVISAHTAFPTETFFDYLTELQEGDVFYIHVLDRDLKYQVDQVEVVLPEQTRDLNIIRNEDHVTLLTCTPYSINTHRLLVRGTRVPYSEDDDNTTGQSVVSLSSGGIFFLGYRIPYWAAILSICVFVALVICIVCVALKRGKNRKKPARYGGGINADNGRGGG